MERLWLIALFFVITCKKNLSFLYPRTKLITCDGSDYVISLVRGYRKDILYPQNDSSK